MKYIFKCLDIVFSFIWKIQIKIMQLSYYLRPKIKKLHQIKHLGLLIKHFLSY